ncbi:V-type ATP synthase subunit I [Candidatus Woesearchaeota archaeon]|nr:V-type ATP synthase subunit I [Candidatus Woesearchaeota archaeon]
MLETERMSKITIAVSKIKQKSVIKTLHDLKVLHIVEHRKTEELDIGTPIGNSEKIAELLVKITSILSDSKEAISKEELNNIILAQSIIQNADFSLDEIETKVKEVETVIKEKKESISKIDASVSKKKELILKLDVLNSLYLNLESYKPFKSIICFVGTIKHKEGLKDKLEKVTSTFKLHTSQNCKDLVVALFVDRKKEKEALDVLKQYNFTELDLTFIEEMKGLPLSHITKLNSDIQKHIAEKNAIIKKIETIKSKNIEIMYQYKNFLSIEAEKAEAPLNFGQTKETVIITGWVPSKRVDKITEKLESITNNRIFIEPIAPDKHESVPIKLKNNLIVKPFEFFMNLYTLPKYKEIDPSFFIFLTFPIFFGFMLGDVGYGIVTLLLFLILKRLIPAAKDLLKAMMVCSFWSILFGFIFGEYFGFEYVKSHAWQTIIETLKLPLHKELIEGAKNEIVYEFPRLINRMHGEVNVLGNEINLVLVIGAIIGFFHINLSILLGFINELKGHGLKTAILARASWYVFEAGLALIVLKSLGIITASSYTNYIGIALLVISIVMIYLGEGAQGIIEIPSIFSNTLSYLRLGAVGLASVGLAVVINEKLAMPFMEKGGIFILISILILIVGHGINIALGIIGPFLHAIRLHYVEFFMRFYKGGGKPFKPFGANANNEEESE